MSVAGKWWSKMIKLCHWGQSSECKCCSQMISHQIIYYKIIPSLHYTEAQLLQTVCVAGTDGQIIKQIIKSGKLQIIIFSCNTSCMMETYNGSTNVANSLCCGELMVKLSYKLSNLVNCKLSYSLEWYKHITEAPMLQTVCVVGNWWSNYLALPMEPSTP